MRRVWLAGIAAMLLFGAWGCGYVARYVRSRAADLADVVTVELTAGPGADVHAQLTGFFGTALGYSTQRGLVIRGRFYGVATRRTAGVLFLGGTATDAVRLASLAASGQYVPERAFWALMLPLTFGSAEGLRFGFLPRWLHAADVAFGASLGVGFHVGLSPGEMLDFLLGFATLDIAGDDAPGPHSSGSAPVRDMPPLTIWPGLRLPLGRMPR